MVKRQYVDLLNINSLMCYYVLHTRYVEFRILDLLSHNLVCMGETNSGECDHIFLSAMIKFSTYTRICRKEPKYFIFCTHTHIYTYLYMWIF